MVINVRRATTQDAAAIARVQVDTWRTTYAGIMSNEFLSNLSYEQRQHMWEDILRNPDRTNTVFVAEEDGRLVGFASCGPARDEKEFGGELYAIYVDQRSQGKGIGRSLTRSVIEDLRAHGFDSMLVWVLAENPFRKFYEALGGKHVRTRNIEIGGKTLKELGYGWKRLDSAIS